MSAAHGNSLRPTFHLNGTVILVGPVLRGFNGGSYRVWFENDPEDLVRATGNRSVLDGAGGVRGQCVSESVQ